MSTLRFDVTTGDWVVFAPSRALRPRERQAGVLAQQQVAQIELVVRTLQLRNRDLMRDARLHPHWQLIATAVVRG